MENKVGQLQPHRNVTHRIATAGSRRLEFTRMYSEHVQGIYAHLLRLTGCRHTAEDLLQETFLKAWRRLDGFAGKSSLKTWLFAIAVNTFRDHARRHRQGLIGGDTRIETAADPNPSAPGILESREDLERLRRTLAALAEPYRMPLMLVRFDGLSYREAAEVLDISVDTLRMRLHRAHKILTDIFYKD